MQEHCVKGFPFEACGLFLGPVDDLSIPTGKVKEIWPANNIEKSARIYSIDPKDMFEATRYANSKGLEIVGVYHSHTHTQSYPSPTDVSLSVDPNWCYAIVSLAQEEIQSKFFKIEQEVITELEMEVI